MREKPRSKTMPEPAGRAAARETVLRMDDRRASTSNEQQRQRLVAEDAAAALQRREEPPDALHLVRPRLAECRPASTAL